MATPAHVLDQAAPRPALRPVRADERAGPDRRPSGPRQVASPMVYRRRRLAAALLVMALLAAGVWALGRAGAGASASTEVAERRAAHTVVVAPGDTVWDVTLPVVPAGADPTLFAAEVAAMNDVDDPRTLAPGRVLRVPSSGRSG